MPARMPGLSVSLLYCSMVDGRTQVSNAKRPRMKPDSVLSEKKGRAVSTSGKFPLLPILLVVILAVAGWLWFRASSAPEYDLEEIRKSGKLRVLISYDPINYFIYRGTPMGYSYELARNFARHLGLPLEVVVVRDMNRQLSMLCDGKGDLVAHLVTITPERKKIVGFSQPLDSARQVLVQRKHDQNDSAGTVRSPRELQGKRVEVRLKSAYYSTLRTLKREKGIDIEIGAAQGHLTTSELIGKVNDGLIDFTVADDNIASTHQALFPKIDIETRLTESLPLAWAVRKESPRLLEALNQWLEKEKKSGNLAIIRDKYYHNQYRFRKQAIQAFYSEHAGTISRYDKLIRQHADSIGWDWRLLSALIYEESRFDPAAVSWAGATGLMQLMPATGSQFSARNLYDPEDNIRSGTRFLASLEEEWEQIREPSNRLRFILASYNVGVGHVRDARKLAAKYGANADLWEHNVEKYLELKSEPRYFNDPISDLGYCNGRMATNYTRNIIERYRLYSQVIPK